MVMGIVGLLVIGMVGVVLLVDEQIIREAPQDPAERVGYFGFFVVLIGCGTLVHLLQILGAVCMLRVKNYMLAYSGAVAALMPCNPYCCLFCLPLGIWALVVLHQPHTKSAFG